MKKILALVLCSLMLFAAACKNEAPGDVEDTTSFADISDSAGGLLDNEGHVISAEDTQGIETAASAAGEIPVPEVLKLIQKDSTLKQEITQLGSDVRVAFGAVTDYVAVLEAAGFTATVERRNDGIYHVNATKDNVLIQIDFIHDNRDDIFDDMIAGGEEVLGRFEVYIYADKAS